jgi:NodT family efflux transporter outer membrane factor (OMF) lipoprotein
MPRKALRRRERIDMKNLPSVSLYFGIFSATALCLLALLPGCKMGADYDRPVAAAQADSWVSSATDPQAEIEQDWWKHFNDPMLDKFITRAIAGNWDLKVAEARIAEARAARATAGNDLLPTVNTDASYERQANRIAFPAAPGFNLAKPFDVYQTGFDASWELDLFGGKRRALESANADLQAAEATRDDARVSLLAEVARTYVDIRQYQAQLTIAQDTITADEETAQIARQRFKAGEAAEFEATQADAQAEQAKAQLPYYQNLLLQAEFSMDVLLGKKAGDTQSIIADSQPVPVADKVLVLAAPAKAIASRPDIRVAERKLASATAQQGVAVAQFFPDVSLSGFLGLLNTDAGDLLRRSSKSWDIGGNVLWPILNYGKLEANLHASDARQQEALAQYQKSVLTALSDVERSVTSYTKEEDHRAALSEAVKDDQKALSIARARYKEGLSSFTQVLDTERTLYVLQSQAAASGALASQNLISVYKSLGGGWQDGTPKSKPEVKVNSNPPDFIGPRQLATKQP